jgi:hypothetical protein
VPAAAAAAAAAAGPATAAPEAAEGGWRTGGVYSVYTPVTAGAGE